MPVLRNGLGAVAVLLLAFGCAPNGGPGYGPAVDWKLRSQLGLRTEVDINRGPSAADDEILLTQALDAGLVLNAETKRALFSADLGIAARYFAGEDDTQSGTGRVDPSFALGAAYRGKNTTLSTDVSLRPTSTEISQIEDTGVIDQNVTQFNADAGVSLSHRLDDRNQVSVGVNGSVVRFSEDLEDLIPTELIGLSLGWGRSLTETSTLNLSAGLRHFVADDEAGTRSQTLDVSAGLNHERTSRHTLNVTLGSTAVRTIEKAQAGDPVLSIGLTGGLGFDYTLKNFRAGLSLTQGVEPSAVGALQSFTRASGSLGYQLTNLQSLGLTLGFTRRTPLSGGDDDEETLETISLGPVYSLRLDPETSMSLSYLFRLSRDSVDGMSSGHRVFLSVNRDFAILD